MNKTRMEAFTDAIIAIIMTILVLSLSIPQKSSLSALFTMKEEFLIYILSFFLLAAYWINHHHLLQIADRINGQALWLNTIMLFFMTLIPFTTRWLTQYYNYLVPSITYGVIFFTINIFYFTLQEALIKANGKDSDIYKLLKNDKKARVSIFLSLVAILLGFIIPILTPVFCFLIAILWIIPSKSIEKTIKNKKI